MGYFSQFSKGLYYLLRSFKMINKKKFLIVLGFLLVFILLFAFNSKVFAAEEVSLSTISGVSVSGNEGTITSGSGYIEYFSTSDEYIYTISLSPDFPTENFVLRASNTTPGVGVEFSRITSLTAGQSYSFLGNSNYVFHYTGDSIYLDYITVTRSYAPGYNGVVDDMVNELSLSKLWSQFNPVVSLIAIGVLFALGFYIFKRSTKGTSKHQAKM